MKNKLTNSIVVFLLLIPLRLPISILFIRFFNWIIKATTTEIIPVDILATNIIMSKIVYNIALSCFLIYNLEMFSRERYKRRAKAQDWVGYSKVVIDKICFWWIVPISILLVTFIIIDGFSIFRIFY